VTTVELLIELVAVPEVVVEVRDVPPESFSDTANWSAASMRPATCFATLIVASGQLVTELESFALFESVSLARTVAVFVTQVVTVAGVRAVIVNVCEAPTANVPLTQVTWFPLTVHPPVLEATVVSGEGTVSATTKPEEVPAPWLVTCTV
jgi:hypothetical protein